MHLTVQLHVGQDRAPVHLQRAPVVVQSHAGHRRDQPVRDPRGQLARPGVVLALLAPSGHDVDRPVGIEQLQQPGDLGRLVLQVAVQRHHDVAPDVIEAGLKRGRLSVVADQQQRPEPRAIACQFGQHRAGIIGRTVVDQDQLEGPLRGSQRGLDPVDQLPQIRALVEDRNYDRHQRQRSGAAGGPRTGSPCGFGRHRLAAIDAGDRHCLFVPRFRFDPGQRQVSSSNDRRTRCAGSRR